MAWSLARGVRPLFPIPDDAFIAGTCFDNAGRGILALAYHESFDEDEELDWAAKAEELSVPKEWLS